MKMMMSKGISLEGFLAWRAAKYGEPKKQTKEEWLEDFKDCAHCKRSSYCARVRFGYHQEKGVVIAEGKRTVVTHGVHINKQLGPRGKQSCCQWSVDVACQLHDKADALVKKGELKA